MTDGLFADEVRRGVDDLLGFVEAGELAFHDDSPGRAHRATLEREALRLLLDKLGPLSFEALSYLCAILGRGDQRLLARLASRLIPRRHHETAGRRFRAARVLGLSGRPDVAVGPLIAALRDQEPLVRLYAAEALRNLAIGSQPVLAALRKTLRDGNKRVRFQVAEALTGLDPSAVVAIPPLAEGLLSPAWHTRERAALSLASLGPAAISAAPLLLEALNQETEPRLKLAQREAYSRITGTLISETMHGV